MDTASSVVVIVVAALLAESIWETGKMVWQEGRISIDRVGALMVGVLFAVGAGLDLCVLLGIEFAIPLVGQVLTGILLSRGANFIHDLLISIENIAYK